jgi:hypothetical protein
MDDFGFGQQPVIDPLGEIDPLTGLRKPVGRLPQQRQQAEAAETSAETRKALAQSLRNTKDWVGGQFSLDTPKDQGPIATGADMALSFVPGIGQAMAVRDIERARRDNDKTGMAMAGASLLPVGKIGGALRNELFGGEKALKAKNLDVAKAAEQAGQDSWDTAGWFRGKENHSPWKFEIDDSKAKLKNITNLHGGEGEYVGKMEDFLHHPELYEQYPEAKNIFVTARRQKSIKPGEGEGSYMHTGQGIDAQASSDEELRNVLLHEVQHHIQATEGFNPGTNANAIAKALRDARVKQGTVPSTADPALTWRLYNRNMGEVESRVVENRSLWSPEQRAANNPLKQMGPDGSLYDQDRTVKSIVQHTAPKVPKSKKFNSDLYNDIADAIE